VRNEPYETADGSELKPAAGRGQKAQAEGRRQRAEGRGRGRGQRAASVLLIRVAAVVFIRAAFDRPM
jgi:hypothetical protein